jgi:hypothetical protein
MPEEDSSPTSVDEARAIVCDVIYTLTMALRIALFAVSAMAVAGLVLLLNGLAASAGIAVTAFGLVAVATGTALGYFSDRLPELPQARRSHRLAGFHHGD